MNKRYRKRKVIGVYMKSNTRHIQNGIMNYIMNFF